MPSLNETMDLYRRILLIRMCEEKIREVYPGDEIKSPVHLSIGQEAIPVGVCHCMPRGTRYFGTYRNHALYLNLTNDVEGFFCELYGKASGAGRGKAGSMHLMAPEVGLMATSAVVGTTLPVAVGAALACQYQGGDGWTVVFFGDGAMEEGVFGESMNFACLRGLRILFVCEDNGLAIHAPAKDRRGYRSVMDLTQAFDCYAASAEGQDVFKVIEKTRKIMEGMEQAPKPGFLHFTYHRFLEHVGVNEDYQHGYRKRPSDQELRQLDPAQVLSGQMARLGGVEADLEKMRNELKERIEKSVAQARAAPFPEPGELCTEVVL
ncbi:MAG: thiamine pyrophosphate-dependent dehydrogenase E1 component subunit alpha [Verrucomicrobiae bacterium]|nr:thiamine pyrophosphate-dependent dehydrogenase E1 component subunit alpha [Verrucomicrobiae bacterium]